MKFAHLSDVHIGGWREPKLRELNLLTFKRAIEICINEHVAFVLIAGDLFNTSLPPIDLIKDVTSELEKLRKSDIEVYIIPGSHDFSPSNKTMIDVLENAGLCINVMKVNEINDKLHLEFTVDKTNTKIAGIYGRRSSLEKEQYKKLDKTNLENEKGFKIFMFHSLISELKPDFLEMIEAEPLSSLPKGFDYYAGGHPHFIMTKKIEGYGLMVYPGATFPNNFSELEKFQHGGFFLVDVSNEIEVKYQDIIIKEFEGFNIDVDGLDPEEAQRKIINSVNRKIKDKIVTLRIHGTLNSGRISDIDFREIHHKLSDAFVVLKNINKLTTKEVEQFKNIENDIESIEETIIKDYASKTKFNDFGEVSLLIKSLMHQLSLEKGEGETNSDFEEKINDNCLRVLKLNNDNKED
ncbi:MAG TPA: exonuclease SbcCD subunit D [Candidatus Nanoarchaeia archaeon]|nr:exonuclease SbcCD subunit D [Candidatus Nanoarchaeia archaeon]